MTVTSRRILGLSFAGDVEAPNLAYNAAENADSPGDIDQVTLSNGNNVIACPATATAVTIIPLASNTTQLVVKGTSADTGISLHLTDPTSIAIDPDLQAQIVLYVASTTAEPVVRLIWS